MDAVDEAVKGITDVSNCEETMAQIALDRLCPALYAVLNHGLRPTLETAFGDINNSVWQVVEASSQQGQFSVRVRCTFLEHHCRMKYSWKFSCFSRIDD